MEHSSERELSEEEIEALEKSGSEAALTFVVAMAKQRWPTLADVPILHRLIIERVNPAMAGEYRQGLSAPQYMDAPVPPNHLVGHCLFRWGQMLERAEEEVSGADATDRNESAIEWAARLHHRFERIHPFEDGNGRTGRMLATWVLLYYNLAAFDVTEETRREYLAALAAADCGIRIEDLLQADYTAGQDEALQSLFDHIAEIVLRELPEES